MYGWAGGRAWVCGQILASAATAAAAAALCSAAQHKIPDHILAPHCVSGLGWFLPRNTLAHPTTTPQSPRKHTHLAPEVWVLVVLEVEVQVAELGLVGLQQTGSGMTDRLIKVVGTAGDLVCLQQGKQHEGTCGAGGGLVCQTTKHAGT